jgi:hypothetical protein
MTDSRESFVRSAGVRIAGGLAFVAVAYAGSFALLFMDDVAGPKLVSQSIRAAFPESHDQIFLFMRTFYRPLLLMLGF